MTRTDRQNLTAAVVLAILALALIALAPIACSPAKAGNVARHRATYGVHFGGPPYFDAAAGVQAVPEPATFGLIGAGLLFALAGRRIFK